MLRGQFIIPARVESSAGKVFVDALALGRGMNTGEHADPLDSKQVAI